MGALSFFIKKPITTVVLLMFITLGFIYLCCPEMPTQQRDTITWTTIIVGLGGLVFGKISKT